MITDAILSIFVSIFVSMLSVFPTGSAVGFNTAFGAIDQSAFFQHFAWANNYFPLTELVDALGLLLTLFVIMMLLRVVLWVVRLLHIGGGGSD